MKGRAKRTIIRAWHHQNPPIRPKGRKTGFWGAIVGPNNLWPWPILTLGPKARAEEWYSRGWVIEVQIVLRHSRGWFCPRHIRRLPGRKGKNSIRTVWKKSKISMPIEEETLDSIATKDKGKVAINAIQYSAPDRAILFNFYNHPQPLWAWADGTSISLRKSILHVNEG